MEASDSKKGLCEEAREYYYDILCEDTATVPEAVIRHVEQCSFCQGQVCRLGEAFSRPASPASGPDDRDGGGIEALGWHFAWLGEPVSCSHVRRFLGDLLSRSRKIRIPTPISIHVEHCPQCRGDLAALRRRNLTDDQLERLGRFYSESFDTNSLTCLQARPAAAAWADFSTAQADWDALNHVSGCPQCRSWMYHQRAKVLHEVRADSGPEGIPGPSGPLVCEDILPAEFFDFVLPYRLDAEAGHKTPSRRDAVAAHVRTCGRCREAIQGLHRAIYSIAERTDSNVQTVCRPELGDGHEHHDGESVPCRYPLRVQALHYKTEPTGGNQTDRRAVGGRKARPTIKVALAAAAVVAVAVLFLANAPTVTGTTIGDLSKALERTANVHLTTRYRDHSEPVYELWLARDQNVLARKTGIECVVYDLRKGFKTVIDRHSGHSTLVRMAKWEYDGSRRLLARYVGGLFANSSADDELSHVESAPSGPTDTPLSVYELERTLPTHTDAVIRHRWRVSLDPETRLPVRIESFRQDAETGEWLLTQTTEFDYLSGSEMESALKALAPAR